MTKRVKCKSGIMGWQAKIRDVYTDLEDLDYWDSIFGICARLGYKSPEEAWRANPTIRGSVNPDDLEIVT